MDTDDGLYRLLYAFMREGVQYVLNGETFESLQPYIRNLHIGDLEIKVLDIEELLKTKTDFREKDKIDRIALLRLRDNL